MLFVIDIGGTGLKCGLFEKKPKPRLIKTWKLSIPKGIDEFYQVIVDEYKKLSKEYSLEGISFSAPGVIDDNGYVSGITAIRYLEEKNYSKVLAKLINKPVTIDNDANCSLLSELWVYKENTPLVSFVVGSGFGGAIMIDQRIYKGNNYFAGEFGYMVEIDKNDNVIRYSDDLSIVNFIKTFNQKNKTNFDGVKIFKEYEKKNPLVVKAVDYWLTKVINLVVNVCFVLNPHHVVFSGALVENPLFLKLLNQKYQDLVKRKLVWNQDLKFKIATYKSKSNLYGAAYNFYQGNK